jgi:hypothetical protein
MDGGVEAIGIAAGMAIEDGTVADGAGMAGTAGMAMAMAMPAPVSGFAVRSPIPITVSEAVTASMARLPSVVALPSAAETHFMAVPWADSMAVAVSMVVAWVAASTEEEAGSTVAEASMEAADFMAAVGTANL